jgi:integrase/recombinase XerD
MVRDYLTEIYPKLIAEGKKTATEYMFPVVYGGVVKAITRQACWMIFKNLWRKTNIKQSISPHQFRHSLATHMLENGADLRSLQLLLGHENVTTVQVYTHLEVGNMRVMYDKKHPRSK